MILAIFYISASYFRGRSKYNRAEKPYSLIVQFGGQTPLKLSLPLFKWLQSKEGIESGAKILGTSPTSIDAARSRRV